MQTLTWHDENRPVRVTSTSINESYLYDTVVCSTASSFSSHCIINKKVLYTVCTTPFLPFLFCCLLRQRRQVGGKLLPRRGVERRVDEGIELDEGAGL